MSYSKNFISFGKKFKFGNRKINNFKCKLLTYQHSFTVKAMLGWNNLPAMLRNIPSLNNFENAIKKSTKELSHKLKFLFFFVRLKLNQLKPNKITLILFFVVINIDQISFVAIFICYHAHHCVTIIL